MKKRVCRILSILLLLVSVWALFSCKKDGAAAEREALGQSLARSVAETAYTPATYAAYQAAFEKAEKIYGDPDVDELRLKAAHVSLDEAYSALVLRADLTALRALMDEEHLEENYTVESFADYQTARNKAIAICDNPESKQALVDSARDVLAAAIAALEQKTDTTELASLLATPIPDTGYTTATYARYANILAEATELFSHRKDEMNKNQAAEFAQDVAICTMEMRNAIDGLVKKGDPQELQKKVEELRKAYTEKSPATNNMAPSEYYSAETYGALGALLDQAEALLQTCDYSQEEFDEYLANLQTAYDGLEVRCITTALENVIMTATSKYLSVPDSYTTESYIALNNAVNAGKDLLRGKNNDQTMIDDAAAKIAEAIAALVQISVPADGNASHDLSALTLRVSSSSVAIGDYFRNRQAFLAEMMSLESRGLLQVIGKDETSEAGAGSWTVETDSGIRVRLDTDHIAISLREDLQNPMGENNATLANASLGMLPMQVAAALGAPTEAQMTNGVRIQIYKDAESGLIVQFVYDKITGAVSGMEAALAD